MARRPWRWQSSRPSPGAAYADRAVPSSTKPAATATLQDARFGTACSSCTRARPRSVNAHRVTASTICRAGRALGVGVDPVADLGDQVVGVDREQAHVAHETSRRPVECAPRGVAAVRPVGTVAQPGLRGREVGAGAGRVPAAYVGVVEQLERPRRVLGRRRSDPQVCGGQLGLHVASVGRSLRSPGSSQLPGPDAGARPHVEAGSPVGATDAGVGVVNRRSPDAATVAGSSPKFTASSRLARRSVNTRVVSSASAATSREGGVGQLGVRTAQHGEPAVDVEHYGVPTGLELDQSSFDRSNVAGSCGSGTTAGSQPIRANSAIRPSAVAVPAPAPGAR